MKQVILDTGVITILLGSKIPEEITALKVQLLEKEIQGHFAYSGRDPQSNFSIYLVIQF